MPLFNEFGKPNDEIERLASHFEQETRNFIANLVNQGCSATEIRAIGSYLSGAVDCAVVHNVIDFGQKLRKSKFDANPNLNQDEQALVNAHCEHRDYQKKIQAIRAYRQRTGMGLNDSKNAIENAISLIDPSLIVP